MFGKTNYTATVRTVLAQMMEDEEVTSTIGAAKFTRSDKKTVGNIFLREGKVYAASINNYVPNIMTRLVQSGFLDEEAISKVSRHFGEGNENDPKLADFLLDRHMVPEKVMATIQQDFFLEVFSIILQWEDVHADWRIGEKTEFYKIDRFDLSKVIDLVDSREEFLDKVADDFGISKNNFNKLTFTKIAEPELDEETPLIYHQLFSVANGLSHVDNIVTIFGLTHFRTIQSIHDLWVEGYIEVFSSGNPIPPYQTEEVNITVPPQEEEKEKENMSTPYQENNSKPFIANIDSDGEVEIDLDADVDEIIPTLEVEEPIEDETKHEVDEPVLSLEDNNINKTHSNVTSSIEKLLKELSHEMEQLKITLNSAKEKLSVKETEYNKLADEISEAKIEITNMEEEYNKIVAQIDAMR